MKAGLLSGIGQGLGNIANMAQWYYGEKKEADRQEELKKILVGEKALGAKQYEEKIIGYTKDGRPVTQGMLSGGEYEGAIYGQQIRDDNSQVYVDKDGNVIPDISKHKGPAFKIGPYIPGYKEREYDNSQVYVDKDGNVIPDISKHKGPAFKIGPYGYGQQIREHNNSQVYVDKNGNVIPNISKHKGPAFKIGPYGSGDGSDGGGEVDLVNIKRFNDLAAQMLGVKKFSVGARIKGRPPDETTIDLLSKMAGEQLVVKPDNGGLLGKRGYTILPASSVGVGSSEVNFFVGDDPNAPPLISKEERNEKLKTRREIEKKMTFMEKFRAKNANSNE